MHATITLGDGASREVGSDASGYLLPVTDLG